MSPCKQESQSYNVVRVRLAHSTAVKHVSDDDGLHTELDKSSLMRESCGGIIYTYAASASCWYVC